VPWHIKSIAKGKSMSQMKSAVSRIRLTACVSVFQIPIQLTFIEQLYWPGNELGAFPLLVYEQLQKLCKVITTRVRMRRSDGLKVTAVRVTLWLEPQLFHYFLLLETTLRDGA
jgi:hypothetical protein